ncbi:MAG: hypothetical protein HY234_07820 [Acidobacteria bacterium]|nr:hypothetical protein [Acidobacteriota bacterium]
MFETPSSSRGVPLPTSDYIQPNLGHGLRIWWAFYWPTSLIAAVLTFAVNVGLRRLYENSDLPGRVVRPILQFDGYFFTYVVALFIMFYILRKNFRHFRIGLLSHRGGEGAQLLKPTLRRALRVWWTYSWRTLVYFLIAWIVVLYPLGWFVGIFKPRPAIVAVSSTFVGLIVGGAVGLYAIYSNILDEDIADFRVCLLSRQAASAAPASSTATPVQN